MSLFLPIPPATISFHASAVCFVPRNMTRLAPPAIETPDESPVGPGIGAVAHLSCISGGSRRRNSPMFHGPVIIIANVPLANS